MKKYFFPMPFKRRWKYNLFENLFFLEIDPDIHRGFEFGEAKFVDVYAARYAGRTSFIRVSEVRVEWQ